MEPVILVAAAAGLGYAYLKQKGIVSDSSQSEPPEYAQVRSKILSDLKYYFDAHTAGFTAYHVEPFNHKQRLSSSTMNDHDRDYLSNALEWAGKCNRVGGKCTDKKITPHISDDQIINNAGALSVAVVWYFYPNATPEAKAAMVVRVIKETNTDVKNLQWMAFLPYIMIAAAAITAGVAIAGAPVAISSTGAISGGTGWAGTGTVLGTVGSTLSTTIPAGLTITGGTKALTSTPKNETELKQNLVSVFKSLDVIMKNVDLSKI